MTLLSQSSPILCACLFVEASENCLHFGSVEMLCLKRLFRAKFRSFCLLVTFEMMSSNEDVYVSDSVSGGLRAIVEN